ncbi:tRNA uridine-5-carboxymethylaminomethyl(34) synthesis GTPase MnmE [Roseovarius arcticus]|uniref:tRNA uridine-5-carboxymethylaminomethyl(34) synthesis GTPase MnmE n=1 Tax=Roseovarius arcticus TaxID=2547404 RepID=UPI00111088FE|nr:tRNA uridine-5-carboxymethylaminomethyl(34) synthesis GTPase MnmE [Roseovarius arcticus]
MDTIYAMSSAQGRAGVSIIRVSGADAWFACEVICGDVPSARLASVRTLRNSEGDVLDQALVLTFAEGASFTGEESVEFQVHGSTAVVSAMLETLSSIKGLRPADPGEFTRRALDNGCLDLAQVEGLADLIDAETEAQRKQALRVFSGELGSRADEWRRKLIRSAALMEATIDFADEEVPVDVSPEVSSLISSVIADLKHEISGTHAAERIRAGFEVAIIGSPNVGKSTLLNRLAGRDAAITSDIAGTTRDVIEVRMDIVGLPVTLLDTAGLRDTDDRIEALGVDLARKRATAADLRVFLVSPNCPLPFEPEKDDIVLVAKCDVQTGEYPGISGKTGAGVDDLIGWIAKVLSTRASNAGIATRARHREAMTRGAASLEAALELMRDGEDSADLAAEELRSAVRGLDSLVGCVDVESVLDEIFASFCLGK